MSPPPNHVCEKDEAFVALTKKIEDVGHTVAIVQGHTVDLKEATKEMSTCIKALSEASIRMQSNQVTRDQFYGKIEELQEKNNAAVATMCAACLAKHTTLDARIDKQDTRMDGQDVRMTAQAGEINGVKTTIERHDGMFRWLWGILAAIIVAIFMFGLTSVYQHLVAGV